jgi:hypothetical protein
MRVKVRRPGQSAQAVKSCSKGSWAGGAGLTLCWSSGPVEGHVNRLKMLKRQMFGVRTSILLCHRVLGRT